MDNNFNKRTDFIMKHNGKNLDIYAENEDEERYLEELKKVITMTIKRGAKEKDLIIGILQEDELKRLTLGTYTEKFMEYKRNTSVTPGTVSKYNQAVKNLIAFFGVKKNLRDLDSKDVDNFRLFLLKIPKNWTNDKFLKDKDIAKLIKNKSKILNDYDKPEENTIRELIQKVDTIFDYFEKNTYIYKNYFKNINGDNMIQKKQSKIREFKPSQLKKIFYHTKINKLQEEYNFIKFMLYTGLRRGEALTITTEDIDITKELITVDGTKNSYSKRFAVIHQDLFPVIVEQQQDKADEDYLFFNNYSHLKTREDKVGSDINNIFSYVIGAELKPYLDIRSLRKNYAQELKKSSLFDILDIKAMMGQSDNKDTLDEYYLRFQKDYIKLNKSIDKVDFNHYFDD